MDEIKRLYVGNVTTTEATALDKTNGVVLKTILIGNNTQADATLTLTIDGTAFCFTVKTKETLIIDKAIVCNIVKLQSSATLDAHISGIQLGEA